MHGNNAPEEYRQNAADCLTLAETFSDPIARAIMRQMAHAWMRLAVQAEKTMDFVVDGARPEA
jgi:hypothetical protein